MLKIACIVYSPEGDKKDEFAQINKQIDSAQFSFCADMQKEGREKFRYLPIFNANRDGQMSSKNNTGEEDDCSAIYNIHLDSLDDAQISRIICDVQKSLRVNAIVLIGDELCNAIKGVLDKQADLFRVPYVTTVGVYRSMCGGYNFHFWAPMLLTNTLLAAKDIVDNYPGTTTIVVVNKAKAYGRAVNEFFKWYLNAFGNRVIEIDDFQNELQVGSSIRSMYIVGFDDEYHEKLRELLSDPRFCNLDFYTNAAILDKPANDAFIDRVTFFDLVLRNGEVKRQNECSSKFFFFVYETLAIIFSAFSRIRSKTITAQLLFEEMRRMKYHSTTAGVLFVSDTGQLLAPMSCFRKGKRLDINQTSFIAEQAVAYLLQMVEDLVRRIHPQIVDEYFSAEELKNNVFEFVGLIQRVFHVKNPILVCDKYIYAPDSDAQERARFLRLQDYCLPIFESHVVQINLKQADICDNDVYRLFVKRKGVKQLFPSECAIAEYHLRGRDVIDDIEQFVFAKDIDEECDEKYRLSLLKKSWTSRAGDVSFSKADFFDILNSLADIQGDFLYVIPERARQSFRRQFVPWTLIFSCNSRLSYLELQALTNAVSRFLAPIREALHLKEIQISQTNSAIGSIMSRNGSHNIGSHVLSALTHKVGTMPDDRVLYQYIQHRMDYIASATTGAPDWSVPTPFVGSVMKMFYSQRHLLEHIAESDGLHAYKYQGKGIQIGDNQKKCVKIVVRKTIHPEKHGVSLPIKKEGWMTIGRKFEGRQKHSSDAINKDDLFLYDFFQEESSVDWSNDENLALPGGILGQHAFYNIVENVLRNAAKHSWARKDPDKRGASNLEIYVDFEKWKTDGRMCFTVGDNMSKLFPEFWTGFFNYIVNEKKEPVPEEFAKSGVKSWPEVFAQPLDGFIVPPEGAISYRKRLEAFLEGKESAASLPPQYAALYAYVCENNNWVTLQEDASFVAALKGLPDSDQNGNLDSTRPGHRLPLPLHHRQELALAKPFIDLETNRLCQEAWGLSEMKISAGYLRRAGVPVIGGLESKPGKPPLIVPMGIPRNFEKKKTRQGECNDNQPPPEQETPQLCFEDMCLAYRFWIQLPKDVLIVADKAMVPFWKMKVKGWDGLGVEEYTNVFGDNMKDKTGGAKGDIGLMSDYEFIIIDHDGDIEPNNLQKLPFRTLRIVAAEEKTTGLPCVPKADLKSAMQDQFKEFVYSAWLGHLKERRGKKKDSQLAIRLKIYEENRRENGLVSDRDIYKLLFRECLHSVLEPLSDDESLVAPQRQALFLISLYPISESDEMFISNIDERIQSEGGHLIVIEDILALLADRVKSIVTFKPDMPNQPSREEVLCIWRTGLEQVKMEHPNDVLPPLRHFLQSEVAMPTVPGELLDALSEMANHSSSSKAFDVATKALAAARSTSEVFLRKYEERISTLPRQYKGIGAPERPILPFGSFGVSISYQDSKEKPDISYLRHSTDDADLYSEPLSGAQTYLNALSNLSSTDTQWAMRLAENGLLRVVIIDERVRAFISDHGEEIKKTYASMHIAVVDTEKSPAFNSEKLEFPDLETLTFAVRNVKDKEFDLVIVHQGIIDKWWPNQHDKTSVEKLLDDLRNPGGASAPSSWPRFVVVTTGRGRPDNIPDTAKVLAFSSIEACLFKRYPEKINLINTLMNILPGSPERNENND